MIPKLHTSEEGRADMKKNAEDLIKDKKTTVASMLIAGMMISLIEDIDTLVEALNEAEGQT